MPYLRLDLAKTYPSEIKRELATRLCRLYADVMQTQLWRPNVGIAELGEDNLFHLGPDGLEPITMVLVEIRRGRSLDQRLKLGRRIPSGAHPDVVLLGSRQDHRHCLGMDRLDDGVRRGRQEAVDEMRPRDRLGLSTPISFEGRPDACEG